MTSLGNKKLLEIPDFVFLMLPVIIAFFLVGVTYYLGYDGIAYYMTIVFCGLLTLWYLIIATGRMEMPYFVAAALFIVPIIYSSSFFINVNSDETELKIITTSVESGFLSLSTLYRLETDIGIIKAKEDFFSSGQVVTLRLLTSKDGVAGRKEVCIGSKCSKVIE